MTRRWPVLSCVLLFAACASGVGQAPVVERLPDAPVLPKAEEKTLPLIRDVDWRPGSYVVQKGDTLYSIALEHGFDYKEIAAWNEIGNPNVIFVGQQLRLTAPPEVAVATPLQVVPPVAGEPVAAPGEIKTAPKSLRLPYSEQALAYLEGKTNISPVAPTPMPPPPKPLPTQPLAAQHEEKSAVTPEPAALMASDENVDWAWPTTGKIIAKFGDSSNLKGIDIAGSSGQPVLASAMGKVVYSGSGIRGYGKLVVIKHNRNYSSVYTHNSNILVKEGQIVSKGQKIAEMGDSDADRVKLHFEIRRLGKPVDPEKLLPGARRE